jgi:hypothetical protein
VNKIAEFEAELKAPATPPAERILALKFLIHFIGDLHQPLHASDHQDRGGNCIGLEASVSNNLHAFWDTGALQPLGDSPVDIARRLNAGITPAEARAWAAGDPKAWALESYKLAQTVAYNLPSRPTCADHGTISLSADYRVQARAVAVQQLEKAGIRMAFVLNQALGG